MTNARVHVHDEESLIESALSARPDAPLPGVSGCPECEKLASDVQRLKNGLASIEDEEPPSLSLDEIFRKKKKPSLIPWIQDLPADWYRNPFALTFGFLMFVVALYLLVVFVFK
jgi:hypothetical protein